MSGPWEEFSKPAADDGPWNEFSNGDAKKQNKGIVGDLVTDLKRGVQNLPGTLSGIGDMVVAPVVGDAIVSKGWDLAGKKTGFQPSKWAKEATAEYSDQRKAGNESVEKAWEDNSTPFKDAASGDFSGLGNVAKAYASNPGVIAGSVAESAPAIVLGGAIGKGVGVVSKMSPIASTWIGEGAVAGGQQMASLTEEGVDARTASNASLATSVGVGALGAGGGKIAKRFGLADVDTALAGGAFRGVAKETADATLKGSVKEAAKRIAGGAVSEGVFEELPQSALEQTLSNLAQGKPWDDGIARASVEGTLAGSLMGGAFNAIPGRKPESAPSTDPVVDNKPAIAGLLPSPTYTGTPGGQLVESSAERQAAIDKAQSDSDAIWAARDEYERQQEGYRQRPIPTIITDPEPIQQRINALMGIDEGRLSDKARGDYEKAIENAFNEKIGVVVGENSLEVPFTMGDYLKSKVAAADITRDRPKAESANQQAVDRLGQLNSEESQQQPDIPVVGVLSRIANAGIRSGAIRRDQTAPVVPPEIQSNPVSNNLSPTQKIDLSQRTDGQLSYLSNKGRPGLREAAIAEIQRRGQTNAAKAQPLAQEATQANDAQAGPQPVAAQGHGQAIDLSNRTDAQLNFLSQRGINGNKEAAVAEIARRSASPIQPEIAPGQSAQQQPAKGAENGQAETEVLTKPGAVQYASPGAQPTERRVFRTIDKWTADELQARISRHDSGESPLTPESEQKLRAELAKRPAKKQPTNKSSPLTVGKAPGSAEPVTVRNGVVYVGEYPAIDYETEADITVPEGAPPQQIADALRNSGALGSRKVFGLKSDANQSQINSEEPKAKQDKAPAITPQHVESGESEPATAAVVDQSLKKGAANSPLDLRQERDLLLKKVDAAIAEAPTAEEKGVWSRVEQRIDLTNQVRVDETIGYRGFDVPGDGKFKVLNLKESLQRFRDRVEANPGFKKPANTTGLQKVAPWQRTTTGGTEATTKELLESGDYTAANEYAKQIGKPLVFAQYMDGSAIGVYTEAKPFEREGYDDFNMVSVRAFGANDKVAWAVVDLNSGLTVSSKHPNRMKAIVETNRALEKTTPANLATAVRSAMASNGAYQTGTQAELEQRWLQWAEKQESIAQQKEEQENRSKMRGAKGGMLAETSVGKDAAKKADDELAGDIAAGVKNANDPERQSNVMADIEAKAANRFERKWPMSVVEAEAQGVIVSGHDTNRKVVRWGVGDNWASSEGNFVTASEALDHYYEVVKPRDEESASKQAKQGRQSDMDTFKAKVAWPVFKDIAAGTMSYVDPRTGEIVTLTSTAFRQQVFKLEEQFGIESKSIGSMEDLRSVSVEIKQAEPVAKAAEQAPADLPKNPQKTNTSPEPVKETAKNEQVEDGAKKQKESSPSEGVILDRKADEIGDFGEKIGGAKKDLWSGYKDKLVGAEALDIKAEPLSKSWPAPDYEALIESGVDSFIVAFIRSSRDSIPRKPTATWKLKSWAGGVELLRDTSMKLIDGDISAAQANDLLQKAGDVSRGMRDIAGRIELYQLVGHRQSLDGISLSNHFYSLYKGKENVNLWAIEKEAKATAFSNMPAEIVTGSTKQEVLEKFKALYDKVDFNKKAERAVSFDIYSQGGKFYVGKKMGRNITQLAGPFDTIKETRAYRDEHHDELVVRLEKAKEIPKPRRDKNEPRVGEDMRDGQDVTPEMFAESFGFKGVEFGNWVEQKKRQKDLNESFDALMDMAAIINVPPRALSLNGQLGLAFGARGAGGIDPAAAHYERDFVVINLTKKEGAGSLGHEWFHALDNYFSRLRGKRSDMMTEALDVSLAGRGSEFIANTAVRKEMIQAFGRVVNSIKMTALRERSSKLDNKRSKSYWTTTPEMSARAFESYLISKLQDQNASNDYLANIVDPETWKAAESLGFELDESYPYPTAGEMPLIREAFDKFFQTVETKETDSGVMLYNIAENETPIENEEKRWGATVDDFFAGKISKSESPVILSSTPASLQALGLPDYEIRTSLAHGVEAAMYNHGIKPSQLKAIPLAMADPQAIFVNQGSDGKYSLNVLTGMFVNGKQIAIALQPSKYGVSSGPVHFVATITPRENGVFAKMAENGQLVYAGSNIPDDVKRGLNKAKMKYGQSAIDLKALIASKFVSTARTSKVVYKSDLVNLIKSGQAQFSADGDVKISPADKAIYGMATEGRSAADILKFIASASRSPFNRQVAKLLLKTGINPTITVDDGKGWKMNAGDGHKYAAAYNPGTDTVALFRPASAERHALHELIHAATIKALSKKGLAAVQMRALFSHVQKNGKAAGLFYDQKTKRGIYGMADIDEFIAEAFSNPKFQALLKQVSAPKTPGSTLSSAWHWFSRIVRGILGLPMNTESALSRALDIGVGVMRENMKINEVISDGITRPSTDRSNPFSRIDEIAKVFERRVGEALSGGRVTGPILVADNTPASMQAFGWADRKVVINLKELQKIAAKPGFETDKAIASIVHDLRRPALMFWNTKNKSINYLRPGKMNMMIGVAPDAEMRNDKDAHLVLTAHLLDRADEQALRNKIERGELVLIYKGREVLGISGLAEKKLPQFNGLLAHGLLHARAADTEAKFKILRESDLVKWEADNWGNGIRYNVADEGWSVSEPSKMDDVIYSLQDKHIDMKRVVQSIFKTGKKVRDEVNAYLQEELFHGRAAKGVKDFLDFELRPLLQEMMRNKIDMGDFEEYLWNAHAQERNEQIAKVNPEMNDGGSGIKTADAKAYLSGIGAERKQIFESLAAKVDAMNRNSQKVLVESGLEKQETIDAWNGAYKHYVPLQREDVDSGHIGTGKGFSIRGSSTKRAMGSGRNVVDIIANLTMQRERNIVRAEKNRVSNALMGLAVENPNDDFWTVDKAPTDRVVEETAIYTVKDVSGEKLEEFTRMSEAERFAKQHPGSEIEQSWGDRVKERIMPGFKSRDNVLLTRVNGEDHYVIFNERDERAMRMALAMKNLDADNLGHVLSVVGKATRYLASINTQFNPVFGVINLIRDTQGALINLSSTPIAGDQKKVLGYTKDALIGIYKDIRAHRAGKKPSSDWAELFEEFQNEGGQTGYRDQYANAEQRAEAIQSELKQFKEGGAKRLVRGVFGWLSDYNETMENAVRLATYKAAKERGISKQQAASVAKSITVNFNRKGQVATQVGALYAFFNASVQGSARLAQTLFEQSDGDAKTIRLSKTGKKILAGGIMLGSMQALLLAAAGFDDDEPPEFIRERNLILPIGDGKYLTLAMPLGFHVIPGIGRIATEFVLAGGKDPIKRMASLFSMFAESFNPVGNAGFSLQTIAPSVVDPFAALAENKDFTGKEIYRENFNALNPTPGHARAKDVASVWSRYISEALNFITGGSEFRPGVFSPSPDAIDYLIGQATGGVGREVTKAGTTIGSAFTGEDLPMYKIPLVGRFVGDTEGQSGQSAKFYDAIKQINMHEAEYKGLISGGRSQEASDYLAENPAVKLIMLGNQTERVVRNLRSKKREMIDSEASQDSIKAIDERITETMARFNERVERVI